MNKKQSLQKQAIELWKMAGRKKWGLECLICGQPISTFHHFILRSKNGIMIYDVLNSVPLCLKHHYAIHFSSSPSEIHRLVEIIRQKRGKKWCDYIDRQEKIHKGGFRTIKWVRAEIEKLEDYLNK